MRNKPSVIYGVALVAGGTVGAGMFALPVMAAGMWFVWATVCLLLVWLINYLSNLLILESNLRHAPGASFDTLVRSSLGPRWAAASNLGIVFIMYILLYAYFSAGGSMVQQTLSAFASLDIIGSSNMAGLLFGVVLGSVVWFSTQLVSRVCVVLLISMVLAFALSNVGLLFQVEAHNLFSSAPTNFESFPYIWLALPVFVAAFACAGIVPSLVKYYGYAPQQIKASLCWGTLLALGFYWLWLVICFGLLSRAEMAPIIESGGNMGELIAGLQSNSGGSRLYLTVFSNFAIITSFLSIGLGLFDYLADRFNFSDSRLGRARSAALTFLPPALLSYFFPKGFVTAITYAGLVVLFCFYLIPMLMAVRNRRLVPQPEYRVAGGYFTLWLVLAFAILLFVCKLLGLFSYLPSYP